MDNKSGIYCIKNKITQKRYIGSAVSIEKRLYAHRWHLLKNNHCNVHLQRAWNKYGEDAFIFKQVLYCDKDKLIFYEQLVIDAFSNRYGWKNMFNIDPTAGSSLGRKLSEETKKKIGLKSKNRWLGKHHTKETLLKMSLAQKGRIITPEARKKLSEAQKKNPSRYWLGKKRPPFSEEWKRNIGKSCAGHKMSDTQKEKLRLINTGRPSPFKGKPGTRLGIKNKPKLIFD